MTEEQTAIMVTAKLSGKVAVLIRAPKEHWRRPPECMAIQNDKPFTGLYADIALAVLVAFAERYGAFFKVTNCDYNFFMIKVIDEDLPKMKDHGKEPFPYSVHLPKFELIGNILIQGV